MILNWSEVPHWVAHLGKSGPLLSGLDRKNFMCCQWTKDHQWQHSLKFLAKIPLFLKWICQIFPYFGESVATSLSTGSNLNDPVQKSCQFRRNLSESIWGYSPVLLQYKQWIKKTGARYVAQQKKSGWRKVSNHARLAEHFCTLLNLVKGTTHPSKYDVTGGLCFWLVNYNDSSRWFAVWSLPPICTSNFRFTGEDTEPPPLSPPTPTSIQHAKRA